MHNDVVDQGSVQKGRCQSKSIKVNQSKIIDEET